MTTFMNEESRYLAIDYGEKRIGLALTDPMKILASPFMTIENNNTLLPRLYEIMKEKQVSKVILGIPFCDDGSETALVPKIRKLKNQIEHQTRIEVILIDERYSSSIAEERIRSTIAKKSKRRQKSLVDMNAAAIILEDYLKSLS